MDEIPENSKDDIERVRKFREERPHRIAEFTNEQILYCINP